MTHFPIHTPIILFPALSLILLAYTEKFLQLGRLLRKIKAQHEAHNAPHLHEQILNLRKRLYLIRNMQAFGTGSFFLCLTSIFFTFSSFHQIAGYTFWFSMILMMIALALAFLEVRLSSAALKLALDEVGDNETEGTKLN